MPSKAKSSEAAAAGDDAIRQHAYLLWEAEGRKDGMADHYWHRAVAEVTSGNGARSKATRTVKKAAAAAAPAGKTARKAETATAAKKAEPKPRAAVGTRKAKTTH